MSNYTYFVVSPTDDRVVIDDDDDTYLYFKFGDTDDDRSGIERRYKTTNPDFYVWAVMVSASYGNLGTLLKSYIAKQHFPGVNPVPGTEWFWGPVDEVRDLAGAMQHWDGVNVTGYNYNALQGVIANSLSGGGESRSSRRGRRGALQSA